MGKLTPAQIDEYFGVHLPYRMRILVAHYEMTRTSWTENPAWLDSCFVASLVTARLFLNVLGIGKRGGSLGCFSPQSDDVTAADLGGKLVDPAALPLSEQKLFLDFLTMADKAAAHFTLPMRHDWSKTHEVILRVHHYLKANLYEPTNRPLPPGLTYASEPRP